MIKLCLLSALFHLSIYHVNAQADNNKNNKGNKIKLFDWDMKSHLGINYVHIFNTDTPNIFDPSSLLPTQSYPVYQFSEDDPLAPLNLKVFELSYYHVIGGFLQIGFPSAEVLNAYPTEVLQRFSYVNHYSVIQAKNAIMTSGGESYNLTAYKYMFTKKPSLMGVGLYVCPWKFLYLKAGISYLQAQQFQVFYDEKGYYRVHLQDVIFEFAEENVTEMDTYAMNYRKINKAGMIYGIALVYENFQMEFGYNELWRSLFLSIGINISGHDILANMIKSNN